jgi:hypothetical protein
LTVRAKERFGRRRVAVRSQPKSLTRSAEDFGGAQSEEAGYQLLSPEALAKVRREAMGMDRRAYECSEVYRYTPPAEPILQVEYCQGKA